MKSSLEDRFEHIRQQASVEPPQQEVIGSNASPLSFVIPTELVDLPSRGKYYPDGHPLKDKTTVEIRQMTTKEEDILTNKSFIKKGVVIDRLIQSILIDKSTDSKTLLVGDKNAIMVAARIATYGPNYDATISCLECGFKSPHQIDLNEVAVEDSDFLEQKALENPKFEHVRTPYGSILIKLPKTGWIVECKLLDGADEVKIYNLLEEKKVKDVNAAITVVEQLLFIVSSINGVFDRATIKEAIEIMPSSDGHHLRNVYQKLIPNIRIQKKYTCSSCFSEQEVELPFTQEFFWPKQ